MASLEGAPATVEASSPPVATNPSYSEEEHEDVTSESPTVSTSVATPSSSPPAPTNPSTNSKELSVSSSAASALAAKQRSVTPQRKAELLKEARAFRHAWIDQVPFPYQVVKSDGVAENEDAWHGGDSRLESLQGSHAAKAMPTALQVLSYLYNVEGGLSLEEMGERVGKTIEKVELETAARMKGESEKDPQNANNNTASAPIVRTTSLAVPLPSQRRLAAMDANPDDDLLRAYHDFVKRLKDPSCAVLVQGLKSFCRHMTEAEEISVLASQLPAYLASSFESLKQHVQWKDTTVDDTVRRALESFVYGHCTPHIFQLYATPEHLETERAWEQRMQRLQFVTPAHLEITALADDATWSTERFGELFEAPMQALRSVSTCFAPNEKLKRILAVYHGVNAALSTALNQVKDDDDATTQTAKRLPSADDVLPTIIYCVLRTQPTTLPLQLQMVEDFAPSEYMRGEAGYAFTNVYGAMQFLQDLDIDDDKHNDNAAAPNLSLTPETWRQALADSRLAMKAKQEAKAAMELKDDPVLTIEEETTVPTTTPIPVQAVREARLRGETVDLAWAQKWLQENQPQMLLSTTATSGVLGDPASTSKDAATDDVDNFVPEGFHRTYSFLSIRPDDVRMSDLPQLLTEYRMLVQTTETLLSDRMAQSAANRKAEWAARQKQVYAKAQTIDPSLLPGATGSTSNTTANAAASSAEAGTY